MRARLRHRSRGHVVACLVVAACATTALGARDAQAEPSTVDVAQARQLFNEGLQLREHGDTAGAVEKLKAANALAHTPITALELGRTYVALGKPLEARETFLGVARIPEAAEETARSKAARSEAAQLAEQLRPRIPTLTVKVTGVPNDTVAVTIDGAVVPAEALAAPRPMDPGRHVIAARSTSGGTAETTVDLAEGEARAVELKIAFAGGQPGPTGSEPTTPTGGSLGGAPNLSASADQGRHGTPVLGWSLLGAGAGVGLAGGALMIIEANRASDARSNNDKPSYDSASTAWTIGLVAAIAGGAVAATGVVLVVVGSASGAHPQTTGRLWVAPYGPGVQLGGAF